MSQIRNDIDKLLERCDARYEKEKAALEEENKLMRDRRTRHRACYLFYVVLVTGIGMYLLCIFLAMVMTGLMGMFEDAITYFGDALIICFVLFALTHIIFFIMRIIIGAPEHQEINDVWMEYYKKLRSILTDADNKDKRFAKVTVTPKYFKPRVEIKAHNDTGVFTEMTISPYFTKHDRHMDEELQTGFTKLESMVNHLQAQSNMPYNEEPADGQALPSVEYGTTVCEMTVPTPQQTNV